MTVAAKHTRNAASSADIIRICIVAPSLQLVGGQTIQAARLVRRLHQDPGFDVVFLPVNPKLPWPIRFLQRIKYLRTIVTSLVFFGSLIRRVPRCDIVHAFSAAYWSYLLAPLPALAVGRLFGKHTVLNYRSGEADDHLAHWRTAVPTMHRLADVIAVPSGYLVDVFARYGLEARSISNFVELDRIPYRRRHPIRPVFLAARNLELLYNVRCIIDAFALVQREIPEAQLLIAGEGSERATLEVHVSELGLRHVEFLGRADPELMGSLYDRAEIYLNSPNIDNMPGSIVEAYAAGLPVVTTDAGGIPYIVRHDQTGLLVPRGDHAAMAAAALRLLRDPEAAARLADAARAECMHRYVWPAVRDEWTALYRELISSETRNAGAR